MCAMAVQPYHDKRYFEASLRPPAEAEAEWEAAAEWGEVLVDKENHTSACCGFTRKRDGKEMELRVTLCLAPPPRVSYFCCLAYTDDGEDDIGFVTEPKMIAAEGNLALIVLGHGRAMFTGCTNCDYFLYQASSPPTLTCLPDVHPDMFPTEANRFFPGDEIGILRYRLEQQPPSPKDAFKIATLPRLRFDPPRYYLCTYDSKAAAWTRNPTAFPDPPPPDFPSRFSCERVITITGGVMAWVDLWRGMLLCDVLAADTTPCSPLRYVPLPEPRQPRNHLPLLHGVSSVFRDIVVLKDGIVKFIDLQIHADPSPCSEIPNGWTLVTWTMNVVHGDFSFRQEHELHSRDIANYDLPQSFCVSFPTLSSHNDGILYLRTSVSQYDMQSRVIALDIKEKKLLAVHDLNCERPTTYIRTTISSYLTPPVSKENMKRRAPASPRSSRKKLQPQPATTLISMRGGDPVEGAGDVGGGMDLE